MERVIKFRAWNIAIKKMIDLKKITPLALNMDTNGLFLPFSDGLILMQFTGLPDKNGKDIYGGDICGLDDNTPIGKIVWDNFNAQFIMTGKTFSQSMSYTKENYFVIGNVYEHPELLTQLNK